MADVKCQINNNGTTEQTTDKGQFEGDDTNQDESLEIKHEPQSQGEEEEDNKDNDDDKSEEKTNLIVNYLPQNMTDEAFEDLFKKFGPTKSCKIVRNRQSGFSYGFGFVDFETHEQALKAIDELNGHDLENKKIKVAFARPAGKDIKQANLYIKNVPNEWTQDDVRKVFEPYGNIIQVRVLGNNRGIAFVLYDLRKQAEDALEALNGKKVDGCDSPFEIKFAADKKVEKSKGVGTGGGSQNNSGINNGLNNRSRNQGQNNSRNRQNSGNRMNDNNQRNQKGFFDRQNDRRDRRSQNNQFNSIAPFNQGNNDIGPIRQAPTNRLSRYAPFVSAHPQIPMTQLQNPLGAPMAHIPPNPLAYGYQAQQQPMIPFSLMTAQNQLGAMQGVNPALAATNQPAVGMFGSQQIPIGYSSLAQNAMNNMYSVATNNLTNAANMQPQLSLRNNHGNQSSYNSNNNNSNHNHNHNNNGTGGNGCTLFVYNIGPESDENELKTLFAPYGQVVKCNVVRKTPGGETKGFGFVTLSDRDQATAAIAGLNGTTRNNRTLQVSMKK